MLPAHIKALILDMDGVIWKADAPIGDLPAIFKKIQKRGLKFAFATNNATKTQAEYQKKLKALGVEAEIDQIVTSAMGAGSLLAKNHPSGTKIFMIGEEGLRLALAERGYEILSVANAQQAEAVVVGIDREINFQKMAEATLLVRNGVPFYSTNGDKTFPTPRGEIPGSGAWLSVIVTATNVQPIIAGKPAPELMELSLKQLGVSNTEALIVGDRLETDIAAGQALGCPTALVLSGVSTKTQALNWNPKIDIIADDLASLVE